MVVLGQLAPMRGRPKRKISTEMRLVPVRKLRVQYTVVTSFGPPSYHSRKSLVSTSLYLTIINHDPHDPHLRIIPYTMLPRRRTQLSSPKQRYIQRTELQQKITSSQSKPGVPAFEFAGANVRLGGGAVGPAPPNIADSISPKGLACCARGGGIAKYSSASSDNTCIIEFERIRI